MRDTVAMQQLNRLQNRNDFLLGDARPPARCGASFRDESKTWVDVGGRAAGSTRAARSCGSANATAGSTSIRVPREGGDATLLTNFDADVTDVVGVDEARRMAVFPGVAGTRRRSGISIDRSSMAPARPSV